MRAGNVNTTVRADAPPLQVSPEELIRSFTQQREIGRTISASASLITRGGGVVTVFRTYV
jgi:hypothetical protein